MTFEVIWGPELMRAVKNARASRRFWKETAYKYADFYEQKNADEAVRTFISGCRRDLGVLIRPEDVRWVTMKDQQLTMSDYVTLTWDPQCDIAVVYGVPGMYDKAFSISGPSVDIALDLWAPRDLYGANGMSSLAQTSVSVVRCWPWGWSETRGCWVWKPRPKDCLPMGDHDADLWLSEPGVQSMLRADSLPYKAGPFVPEW